MRGVGRPVGALRRRARRQFTITSLPITPREPMWAQAAFSSLMGLVRSITGLTLPWAYHWASSIIMAAFRSQNQNKRGLIPAWNGRYALLIR